MIIAVDSKNPFAEQIFAPFGSVRLLSTQEMKKENLRDVDAIIVRSETRVDKSLLEDSSVRFVGTATIGVDHVDQSYLRDAGIAFAYAPGSNANSVAEYVVSALLVVATQSRRSLYTMSLGIVGVGNVGSKVARMASSFGMKVLLNDPPLERTGAKGPFVHIEELMSCDVVTLHVPLTHEGQDKTHYLFDANRFRRMKKGAFLINTSRGPVVNGADLKHVLESGQLQGAVLDVWEGEPAIDLSLLERASIGTPHIAGYSFDGKLNAVRMMADALAKTMKIRPVIPHNFDSPSPESAMLEAPRFHVSSLEHGVLDVTQRCYDILHDDASLRALRGLPPEERPLYFRKLRAEYPMRREFGNFTVSVTPDEVKMSSVLSDIGFKVNHREHKLTHEEQQ